MPMVIVDKTETTKIIDQDYTNQVSLYQSKQLQKMIDLAKKDTKYYNLIPRLQNMMTCSSVFYTESHQYSTWVATQHKRNTAQDRHYLLYKDQKANQKKEKYTKIIQALLDRWDAKYIYLVVCPVYHNRDMSHKAVYNKAMKARQKMQYITKQYNKGNTRNPWGEFLQLWYIWSYEYTITNNGYNWHYNMVVATDKPIPLDKEIGGYDNTWYKTNSTLSRFYKGITGDSHIVSISPIDTTTPENIQEGVKDAIWYMHKAHKKITTGVEPTVPECIAILDMMLFAKRQKTTGVAWCFYGAQATSYLATYHRIHTIQKTKKSLAGTLHATSDTDRLDKTQKQIDIEKLQNYTATFFWYANYSYAKRKYNHKLYKADNAPEPTPEQLEKCNIYIYKTTEDTIHPPNTQKQPELQTAHHPD